MPGGAADERFDPLAPSAPTAKTLSARAVCVEPHDGHLTRASSSPADDIVRCNCSNRASHFLHTYS
jgi:hypothetical protein